MVQAKQFKETTDVTGLVLTKLDGTAKGGIVLAIRNELHLPVKLVGLGEGIDDFGSRLIQMILSLDCSKDY